MVPAPADDQATTQAGTNDMPDDTALYDGIMAEIEPELTSGNLPHLNMLAEQDSPEQRKARTERYAAAFEEYDRRFKAQCEDWHKNFKMFQRTTMRTLEINVRTREEEQLNHLEQAMATAA